ncbi:CD82 antigen-like [Cololabis saira]|uniref:CD82 antigen-like n=1 Tax=Cololabis saira TaxID=129043 RepID=UPI002AD1E4BF|nr:CD82 antigen-like [Cololabis saira]XP_061563376.1 CD82 antigen-like [Cololabis saira]XP_061563384.1 CD82 antigen-like [Cololabis saira]XP_061563392.1 CD82 antigen-like [Cololabis saira]
MGKACMTASKYFLFLFNLLFFLSGLVILGFGLWLLLDNQSFILVINDSVPVKATCFLLITAGSLSMLMGFVGCLGAVYEIRALLVLYFTSLLLILMAQVVAGVLIYFQKDVLNDETSKVVTKVLDGYRGNNSSTEQAWDFVQRSMSCCGWTGRQDWSSNLVVTNSSQLLFPCSCHNVSLETPPSSGNFSDGGFCEAQSPDWPVYDVGCAASVESWLTTNMGVVLGISAGVAFIELLGMILSVCLCKNVHNEDYTKVPKY